MGAKRIVSSSFDIHVHLNCLIDMKTNAEDLFMCVSYFKDSWLVSGLFPGCKYLEYSDREQMSSSSPSFRLHRQPSDRIKINARQFGSDS